MPGMIVIENARSAAGSRWTPATRLRGLRSVYLVLLTLPVTGCFQPLDVRDQTQFASLTTLSGNGQAVARVYGATIPFIGRLAIHTWIVTKRADEQKFHRWEIWRCPDGDYDFVCKDFATPAGGIGSNLMFVIGERVGPQAEAVVTFVEQASPLYPFRNRYVPVPGPNSNTFTQWLLDNSGWDLQLRPRALGADWNPPRGWPSVTVNQD